MKKVNKSPKAQQRRRNALSRFGVNPKGDKAYQERKALEQAALKLRLGDQT